MTKAQTKRFYLFGVFRIDVSERILYGPRGRVPLTPKAFDTLLALVEESGHVLGKVELMEKLWPDSFVEENNLVQNISALRKALAKDDGERKYIETVQRRGYRFVAEVRESFAGAEVREQAGSVVRREKVAPLLRDVVLIGRAVDFKA